MQSTAGPYHSMTSKSLAAADATKYLVGGSRKVLKQRCGNCHPVNSESFSEQND